MFGIDVLELEEERLLAVVEDDGVEVYGMNGGKELGVGVD